MYQCQVTRPTTEYSKIRIKSLLTLIDDDILNDVDIANALENAMNKNIENKILKVHVTNKGLPRRIVTPIENRRGYWSTCTPDRKEIFASTKEDLFRKLYLYYYNELPSSKKNPTFEEVWKKAHEHYNERHPDKTKTIQCHEYDFNRFIDSELRKKSIISIDTDYLEVYAIKMCKANNLSIKAYKNFKGVLNLTFKYALRHSKDYDVSFNPAQYLDDTVVYPYLNQETTCRDASDVLHSPQDIKAIFDEAEKRSKMTQFHGYYIYKYLIQIHDEIGCRPGELVALKWNDLTSDVEGNPIIHIHAQQVDTRVNGNVRYVQYTKNEKGLSKGGRYFPVTDRMKILLDELKELQDINGISSEFIFCDYNGKWINVKQYNRALKSICESLNIKSKGSYAFRRDVNCAMYEAGMSDIYRGKAIGNGPLTNILHYVHPKNDYTEQARKALTERNKERSEQVRTDG